MNSFTTYVFLLLISVTTTISIHPTTSATIGLIYSTPPSVEIYRKEINVSRVISMKIQVVRLLDLDPAMIGAFADTNISLFLSVPNSLVLFLASNRSVATRWVNQHVVPFYLRTKITIISVGNDPISYFEDLSPYLLQAIKNIHLSLTESSIDAISVSTTFSFCRIVVGLFPPSVAQFQEPKGEEIIRPILQFLQSTNSSFLINLYPFNVVPTSDLTISAGFTFFDESPLISRKDPTTEVVYRNIFDMMVDSVIRSMAVMDHEDITLIVAETGWPSSTGEEESERFLKGLLSHLNRHRSGVSMVYVAMTDYESLGKPDPQKLAQYFLEIVHELKKVEADSSSLGHKLGAGAVFMLVVFLVRRYPQHVPTVETLKKSVELMKAFVENVKTTLELVKASVEFYNFVVEFFKSAP